MDDNGESQALLMKEFVSENESYRIDGGSSSGEEESYSHSDPDGWWGGTGSGTGSSCSSSCFSSDSGSG